jgi:sirohydrochlorin cobaltochelatase
MTRRVRRRRAQALRRLALEGKDQAMTDQPAVLICGHGSRDGAAIREFDQLAATLAARLPGRAVAHAYLEFGRPVIRDGLEALKSQGARHIICLPGMLFAAGHVKNDLPSEIHDFARDNPDIDVVYGRDLDIDARLIAAAAARIEEAEAAAATTIPRDQTLLLVVGRGTRDPDANSNVAKVTRLLWEGMGFGWAEAAYSGVAHPLGDVALTHALRLGYRRVIVFPYFLFTGVLVRRIYDWADAAQGQGVEILKAPYLNDHSLVIETFLDRLREATEGAALMNCALCKYRTPILGHETSVGAAQQGHHHHVRGIGFGQAHTHE